MYRWIAWGFGALVGLLLLPFILAVMGFRRLFGLHRSRAGPDYLVSRLEKFALGVEGDGDWAAFCRVSLRDSELEALRRRAAHYAPPRKLGREERDALFVLLEEAKAIQCARG